MAMTSDRRFFVEDVRRGQWSPGRRNQEIKATADKDGPTVVQWLEREAGVGGADRTQDVVKLLAGHAIKTEPATGSKEFRAEPFAAQAEAGNVWIVKGEWNHDFLAELCEFPGGSHDDQVDAASGALNKLSLVPMSGPAVVGGSRSTPTGMR
jgi:predicted phage terminase large subunit-like protein